MDAETPLHDTSSFPRLRDVRLDKELEAYHPRLQPLDEVRKQLTYLRNLILLTWSREELLTVLIGACALLLGALSFDGELSSGGDVLKVGITPLGEGMSAVQPLTFIQLVLSLVLWVYFIFRLWNQYPLMKGQSVSLLIVWFGAMIVGMGLHLGAPRFPLGASSEGLTTVITGSVIGGFFAFIFARAVLETRDLHVDERHFNEDPRVMAESLYDHSLSGWVALMLIWIIAVLINSWSGAHYVAMRPHASVVWQLLYLFSGFLAISGMCILLWFPQLMLGVSETAIISKRAREVGVLAVEPARKSGQCPDCGTDSAVFRGQDGIPKMGCPEEGCEGEGAINAKCEVCESSIPTRLTCGSCGVNSPAIHHLEDAEAW